MIDVAIIGAGPNGLAAAVALAQAGLEVRVFEAQLTPGGGARTAELTLPGFRHDVCSAIHPTAVASPYFRTLPLAEHGVEWLYPEVPVAHPLDGGEVALLERDFQRLPATLGRDDAAAWRALYQPLTDRAEALWAELLGPPPVLSHWPRHPLELARFGLSAMRSAVGLAHAAFTGEPARALFAGCAAHSFLPLTAPFSASFGLVLGLSAHAIGWPLPRGGSSAIVSALERLLVAHGGAIECGRRIERLDELPASRAVLFDTSPSALAQLAGDALPAGYRRRLARFRHGPGVLKLDYALSGPMPWANPACARASTVHLAGTLEELAHAEHEVAQGRLPERPFVLVAQQSLTDPSRAPAGHHTLWAYAHVPHGLPEDATARATIALEAQLERFAPGFGARVLARHVRSPAAYARYNPNCVGGDITGGANDLGQLFTRPVACWPPYATPNPRLFLCSSSTPPGGGVHGMCGYWAAATALKRVFGKPRPPLAGE